MVKTSKIITWCFSFLFAGLFFTTFISKVSAQACPVQAPVNSVTVAYPGCEGTNCNFTQASCAWSAATGATSYKINVTEIETSVAIKANETVASTITQVVFPITQNRTYKCDVVAVNSCGNQSTVLSDQLLCSADGLLGSTAPTSVPGSSTTPGGIAAPGGIEQTLLIMGGILVTIIGGVLMITKK